MKSKTTANPSTNLYFSIVLAYNKLYCFSQYISVTERNSSCILIIIFKPHNEDAGIRVFYYTFSNEGLFSAFIGFKLDSFSDTSRYILAYLRYISLVYHKITSSSVWKYYIIVLHACQKFLL